MVEKEYMDVLTRLSGRLLSMPVITFSILSMEEGIMTHLQSLCRIGSGGDRERLCRGTEFEQREQPQEVLRCFVYVKTLGKYKYYFCRARRTHGWIPSLRQVFSEIKSECPV